MLVRCKVCGTEYDFCPHCAQVQSWRRHTDTADHYYLWLVLMTYQTDKDAKAAYDALQKRGIDIRDVSEFKPNVRELLTEIKLATSARKGKVKKAEPILEEAGTEDTEEAAEAQQD